MSIIGNYLRVSPSVLKAMFKEPSEIFELLNPPGDDPEDEDMPGDHPEGTHLDIGKTWQLIHFLLTGSAKEAEAPLTHAVLGGTLIGDEDVGYGPARGIKSSEVKATATALAQISPDELWSRFDAQKAKIADLYPMPGWYGSDEEREFVLARYVELQKFFADSSADGQAIIAWLD